uniref:Bifunctional lysine-specific demethylase and histidyl-hydroxylase n=1 Tax=Xenopus tropicalis TaxID=8364 RepID=A0A6I8SBJ2_XENTR|eukprot:XP_012819253.1 PREDICTED: bifunctional lysine-specific demethylase and histidyl-hydroxylase NO66 isoform X2 [Xenopus tropicalis]
MEVPRVSALAAYKQQQQEVSARQVLKKSKRNQPKLSQKNKLLKKKRKLSKLVKRAEASDSTAIQHQNGLQDDNRELLSPTSNCITKKEETSTKRAKKLRLAAENENRTSHQLEGMWISGKQHTGPPLMTVLQDLSKIHNSKTRATSLFEWLISPLAPADFFRNIWEQKPALIKRDNHRYYDGLFSTTEFDRILREDNVKFGVNLDVTSYTDGTRETHNPPGRALPLVVWDYFKNGCSLRLLNPQSFCRTVWNVLSVLQELFGSMVGANTYLTPAGTQGFAPHYDDIEAFVIQLEGKKHWRVYNPRNNSEFLPQFSSVNFRDRDIGEPILETVLEAGDLLYFPRGFIHQGDCLPDAHSLHITISSYQRNSWADLLEKVLPAALQVAVEEDVEFRKGLPLDYLEYMGVQHADLKDPRRDAFIQNIQSLIKKLSDYAPVDAAVDQKAKNFLHDCLPPVLTPAEKTHSVHGAPVTLDSGKVKDDTLQIELETKICLLRGGIARLCSEGDACLLYYSSENSRIYHRDEPNYMEIAAELTVATILFEKGLLTTREQLNPLR